MKKRQSYFYLGSLIAHTVAISLFFGTQLDLEAKASTAQLSFRLVEIAPPSVEVFQEQPVLPEAPTPELKQVVERPKRLLPKQPPKRTPKPPTPKPPRTAPKSEMPSATSEEQTMIRPEIDSTAERDSYLTQLISQLERSKQYPRRALRRHQEGTAELRLVLSNVGSVIQHAVLKSSGSALLDEEVQAMVERAQPFPPFPEELKQRSLSVLIPIEFKINR